MKSWLYKRNEKPRVFEENQIEAAIQDGWVDSPAKVKKQYEDYPLDELKTHAMKNGISFPSNITKKTIIEKLRSL